jgi:hypothetical protein
MQPNGIRSRVVRLLDGTWITDDITRIFLFARDPKRAQGRESVVDIGDFVAHHDERTKGVVTDTTRDFFALVTFSYWLDRKPVPADRLPSNFIDILWAGYHTIHPKVIGADTGLSQQQARKLLKELEGKFIRNWDRTLSISPIHSPEEMRLVWCLSRHLRMKSAFTGDRLFEDLKAILLNEQALLPKEATKLGKVRSALILYAVTVMHRSTITLANSANATLMAWAGGDQNSIDVNAHVPATTLSRQSITISAPMFVSGLPPADHCEPELLQNPIDWNFDLEIKQGGLLGRLA